MRALIGGLLMVWFSMLSSASAGVVDTGQSLCYGNHDPIPCPMPGQPFYGQDAQYAGAEPAYRDHGDGTVTDLNTGLMWSKAVGPRKMSLEQAEREARSLDQAGHHDWRVPTIQELYSLMDFRGRVGMAPGMSSVPANAVPFINTDYFDFQYGNLSAGERFIDAQWLTRTRYVSLTMEGMETLFGANFADGRIKGYGFRRQGTQRELKSFFVRFVRGGQPTETRLRDNGNGTLADRASGLVWQRDDSGRGMNWQQALAYCEGQTSAGLDDWRLPNAKELHSIVDYQRSPDSSASAAIDPLFQATPITNEAGQPDFPAYWTSTTHDDGPSSGAFAVYIAFGRAMGQMRGRTMDVHGAGAQRSDPKIGSPAIGHGPQGDAIRVNNFVRCVRGGGVVARAPTAAPSNRYPNNVARLRVSGTAAGVITPPGGPPMANAPGTGGARPPMGFAPGGMGMPQGGMPGMGRAPIGGAAAMGPVPGRMGMPQGGMLGMGRPPLGGGNFVQRLDRDGDGRVSRAEFDGPPDRFGDHDRNGDGFIGRDEAPQGPPPRR